MKKLITTELQGILDSPEVSDESKFLIERALEQLAVTIQNAKDKNGLRLSLLAALLPTPFPTQGEE